MNRIKRTSYTPDPAVPLVDPEGYYVTLDELRAAAFRIILREVGDRSRAARAMGIARSSLYRMMKRGT